MKIIYITIYLLIFIMTQSSIAKDYSGSYYIYRPGFSGGVELKKIQNSKYSFELEIVNWEYNTGLLSGEINFKNERASFIYKDTGMFGCNISFKIEDGKLYLFQKHGEEGGTCGAGINVEYTGMYLKGEEPVDMIENEIISIDEIREKIEEKSFWDWF